MTQTIIGIDPGKSGGIAVIDAWGKVTATKMPATTKDILDFIRKYTCIALPVTVVFVEKVNAGPKMGSSAAFKFGQNVGIINAACLAYDNTRTEYVSPQKWQKELGLIVKGRGLGQDDTSKKNRNKARAQELYPGICITHSIADALLIATYGQRVLSGRITDGKIRPQAATDG